MGGACELASARLGDKSSEASVTRPRREFRTEERKLLSFLSLKQLKLRRNFREIQNLESPEKPGSERHLAPESPEILKIASNSTTFNEITPKTW